MTDTVMTSSVALRDTATLRLLNKLCLNGGWALWGGAAILLIAVLCAVFAPWIAPHSPYEQSLDGRLLHPIWSGGTWEHVLGTDHLGRDYLSRMLYGVRFSLLVGFGTVLLSALIGISLGLCAGFYGGRVDFVVMFLLNVRLSLPVMLATIAIVGLFGNSLALMMVIMACFLWDHFLVVARSMTSRLRDAEYVLAAKSAGYSDLRILLSEVLPNLAGPLVVIATLEMSHAILLEAALSFLGLGIRPPDASWGLMIAEAKDFVFFEAWLVNIPGFAIFTLIAAITLLGGALQKLLVPADAR